MSATGQTFLFCIGAAKAGTSWLFDVLYHHDECYFPAVKELHYWDVLENGKGVHFREQSEQRLDWLKMRRAKVNDPEVNAYQDRSMADIRRWLDLFDGHSRDDAAYLDFLGRGRDGARVIGDFTPSYALLETGSFKAMAGLMDRVKFLFILRDPVERMWSHARMDTANPEAATAKFDSYLAGGEVELARRTNYRRTLNKLLAAIPRENLLVEVYERLFSPQAVARVCAFLGIAPVVPDFAKSVNPSQVAVLDDARRAQARDLLAPQYNFAGKFLGEMPGEWTQKGVVA